MRGTVLQVSRSVEASDSGRRLQSYQRVPDQVGVRVRVRLELINPTDQKTVWSQELSGFRRVAAPRGRTTDADAPSSLAANTESVIETSYSDIARDITRDAYDLMLEVF